MKRLRNNSIMQGLIVALAFVLVFGLGQAAFVDAAANNKANGTKQASSSSKATSTAKESKAAPKAPAKPASPKPFAGAKVKTFPLSAKSYIQLKDVYFKYGSKEKEVYFTLTVYNGDQKAIDFLDYWVELYTSGGSKYPVKSFAGNSKSGQVAPKTSKDFILHASIDPSMYYNQLVFKIVKWDFSVYPDYTRVIGETKLSSSYNNAVPTNHYYTDKTNNNQVKTYLQPGAVISLGSKRQVDLTWQLNNFGKYDYQLPEYQFYLRTKAGHVVKMSHQQVEKVLTPGGKLAYTLRTSLPISTKMAGAQLLVTTLEGEAKTEVPKAIYNIGWANSNPIVVNENKAATIKVGDKPVTAQVMSVYANNNDKESSSITMTMKWLNKGKQAVQLPEYKYELLALDGTRYPAQAAVAVEEGKTNQVVPNIAQEIMLQSTIPAKQKKGLKLIIVQPGTEEDKTEFVAAMFKLKELQAQTGVLVKNYKSAQGSFEIKIAQAERLPWGNQDLLNAFIEVKNTGSKSQALPKLIADLRLNGQLQATDKVNFIPLGSVGMIEPKESAYFVISTKVAYSFKLNEINVQLTDEISETKKQTIGIFKLAKITAIPEVATTGMMKTDLSGRKATMKYNNTYLFEGADNNLLYAQFEYANNEKRSSMLPALSGYFKTADGQYIEATFVNVKASLVPGGKALLVAKAQVPKSFAHDGATTLVVGQGLTGKEFSNGEAAADSYIAAHQFKLPKDQNVVSDTLTELAIAPYTFSLNKLNAMVSDVENVKLEINYSLQKGSIFQVAEKESKLYFEVTNGENAYGATVKVLPTEGEGLRLGESKQIVVPIQGVRVGNTVLGGFKLNIYEEVDGYKRLIGSKPFGSYQLLPPSQ
ncbi:hypothetical protein ACFSTH_19525 [Paenibacillus yanchengensis]|uniref:Uncharacterized protein n=1 Tax=Paenibacillus yanchengensis TaxID=2035833 RepID=A0ABW4YN47_9BACL